jgi:hypothetical protein
MKTQTHPYVKYENTPLWSTIEKAVNELVKNQDIDLTTKKEYVIGYLCKKISDMSSKKIKE